METAIPDETPNLRIFLLGGFRVTVGGVAIPDERWRLRRARSLIKLLALTTGRRMHREQVVDLLWPDRELGAAANSLHQVLHAARHALASAAADGEGEYLHLRDDVLSLAPHHPPWIDSEAFAAAAQAAQRDRDPAAYHAALDHYAGDLLPEDRYEEWAAAPREALHALYLDLLREVATLYEVDRLYAQAIDALRRVLTADPAQEVAHTGLMRLYVLTGRRQEAIRQYQILEEALRRELDVAPQPASTRLYQEILAERFPGMHESSAVTGDDNETTTPDPTPPWGVRRVSAMRPHSPVGSSQAPATAGDPDSPLAPHNLPAQVNSFVGRAREIAEIRSLLAATRLLTLAGAGGCGKTRLAVQIAAELPTQFADGVWFVDLAGLGQPSLVAPAVAAALAIPEQAGSPPADTLGAWLRPRRLLLMLDNCEHLIAACAALAESLLRNCPRLHILATSREPLRVQGEVVWRVASLTLPDPRLRAGVEGLMHAEAAQLFVDRARGVLPSFILQDQHAPSVARICHRLDGMPLAIELAAARLAALSVEQIAARLDDCFRLLTGGSRTALSRRQALKATLDWSHDLLPTPEQILFRRLAVFAGGFTLEAAEAVGGADGLDVGDVLDLLTRLIDKSLVVAEQQVPEARYRLLEPIRQYAQYHLETAGETARIRGRHTDWCLALAERARDDLWTARHATALARLENEHDNLRAALDWCLMEQGAASRGLQLAGSMWQFWLLRGYLVEGYGWLDRLLTCAPERSALRAATLLHASALANRLGNTQMANTAAEQSLSIYRDLDDIQGIVRAACCLASPMWLHGARARPQALFTEAVLLSRDVGFTVGVALATHALGMVAWSLGEYGRAGIFLEESLTLLRQAPDVRNVASVFINLGIFDPVCNEDGTATALIEETVLVHREVATPSAVGFVLANLGNLARMKGDHERARQRLEQSVAHFRRIKDPSGLAQTLGQLGNLAREEGEYDKASTLLAESLALRRDLGERLGVGRTLDNQGTLALAQGDYAGARRLYEEGEALFWEMGDRPGIMATLDLMGHLAMAKGDYAEAYTLFGKCADLLDEMSDWGPHLAVSRLNQGVAAWRQGNLSAAQAREVLRFYRAYVETTPDDLTTLVVFLTAPPAPFIPAHLQGTPMVGVVVCHAGAVEDGAAALRPLRAFGPPAVDMIVPMPYTVLQTMFDHGAPRGLMNYTKSEYLGGLDNGAIDVLTDYAARMTSPLSAIHIHQMGGAMSRIGAGETAYANRAAPYTLNILAVWEDRDEAPGHIAWVRELAAAVQPFGTGGVYVNFLGDEGESRVRAAYGAATYDRLAAVKHAYDPTNLFRLNQNIKPRI